MSQWKGLAMSTGVAGLMIGLLANLMHVAGYQQTRFELFEAGLPYQGGHDVVASEIVLSSPVSGGGDVYSMDMSSRTVSRITSTDTCEVCPVVSESGDRLAYCREGGYSSEVVVVTRDTGESVVLVKGLAFNEPIAFTEEGDYLLVFQFDPGVSDRHVLVNLNSYEETVFDSLVSLGEDVVIGVEEHQGENWITEWTYQGQLSRRLTRGDRLEAVDGGSEMLVMRESQWWLISDNDELMLPIVSKRLFIKKVGEQIIYWDIGGQSIGVYNVVTGTLSDREAPAVRVSGILSIEGEAAFRVTEGDETVLSRLDYETLELSPLVSVDSAMFMIE